MGQTFLLFALPLVLIALRKWRSPPSAPWATVSYFAMFSGPGFSAPLFAAPVP